MAPKKIKKRPKQNLSNGSGSSSESDGSKGVTTKRCSERLGKQNTDKYSPVIDLAYDGDGETTEESVSENSDQVMQSVASSAYDFEDDAESSPQTRSLYPENMRVKSRREAKVKKKPDKNNSSKEKRETKVTQTVPKANKSSISTLKKSNNFSVASILKTKFDNKIVEIDGKSHDQYHSDNSMKLQPLCKKQNTYTGRKSPVTRSNKISVSPGTKSPVCGDNNTPDTVSSKNTLTKKTPVSSGKNTPALSSNKKSSKSFVKKNTPVLSSNKKTLKSSINKRSPVVSFNKKTLVTSVDKNSLVTSVSRKSTKSPSALKSNTSVKSERSTTTKRKAAGSGLLSSSHSPQQNDSGMFISPPPVKVSKLCVQETSTPSGEGVEGVKDSCFGFTSLNLVGSPMLSPVKRTGGTPTSDYCSAILSLSEISVQDDLADVSRSQQHSVFSGDNLEPDIALNKSSSKTYKSSKQKRAKGRYSSSKVEAWAEKVNQEFDELDNFELSIEG